VIYPLVSCSPSLCARVLVHGPSDLHQGPSAQPDCAFRDAYRHLARGGCAPGSTRRRVCKAGLRALRSPAIGHGVYGRSSGCPCAPRHPEMRAAVSQRRRLHPPSPPLIPSTSSVCPPLPWRHHMAVPVDIRTAGPTATQSTVQQQCKSCSKVRPPTATCSPATMGCLLLFVQTVLWCSTTSQAPVAALWLLLDGASPQLMTSGASSHTAHGWALRSLYTPRHLVSRSTWISIGIAGVMAPMHQGR
jgi:hypothetical protein